MRLLVCNYEYPPVGGGAATATANMARHWVEAGHEVTVVTSGFKGLPAEEIDNGVRVIRVPALRKALHRSSPVQMVAYMAAALVRCIRLCRKESFGVTLAFFGIPGGPLALALKWLFGIPYAVSLRGGDVPGQQAEELGLWHKLAAPVLRAVWKNAGAVVANSKGLAQRAKQFIPKLDYEVIPNGVDTGLFSCSRDAGQGKDYVFMSVGRLSKEKKFQNVIQRVSKMGDDVSLRIAGDGPELERLKGVAHGLGLGNRVDFLGHCDRSEMPALYQQADCLVHYSSDEGMPNVVLEAMACGVPVIASKVSGSEELVVHNETGLLVEASDDTGLGAAMAWLAASPEVGREMGAKGRARAEQVYSWKKAAGKWEEVLEKI